MIEKRVTCTNSTKWLHIRKNLMMWENPLEHWWMSDQGIESRIKELPHTLYFKSIWQPNFRKSNLIFSKILGSAFPKDIKAFKLLWIKYKRSLSKILHHILQEILNTWTLWVLNNFRFHTKIIMKSSYKWNYEPTRAENINSHM